MFLVALLLGAPACAAGPYAEAPAPVASKRLEGPSALFLEGQRAAKRGDAIRAEQYFSLALEQGYERTRVVRALIEVCVQNSRLRAALLHAEPYLRDHPDDHDLRYLVATIHWGLGERDLARRQLALLVRQSPRAAAAHYLLGVLEGDANPDVAIGHFERYLEDEPRGSRAVEVRGRLTELRFDQETTTGVEGERP